MDHYGRHLGALHGLFAGFFAPANQAESGISRRRRQGCQSVRHRVVCDPDGAAGRQCTALASFRTVAGSADIKPGRGGDAVYPADSQRFS